MLILSDLEPLFIGGTRFCYLHPSNPDRCIKVLRPDRTGVARKHQMTGWKQFRPASSFDDQLKEIKAYKTLLGQKNPRIWKHIPDYYGTEATDMGIGIVTRLLRNDDGSFPPNLQDLVRQGISPALEKGITEFRSWLLEEAVVTRDLLPHNIIAVTEKDGSQRVIIVDGIGNSEFIPISTWFTFFARQKISRKLTKFTHRLELLLP